MSKINCIGINEFVSDHILKDGLTVIDIALEFDPYWTVRILDDDNTVYLAERLFDDDLMVPMLFESPLVARKYIDDAVDSLRGDFNG